jgi:hypothetical protein
MGKGVTNIGKEAPRTSESIYIVKRPTVSKNWLKQQQ